MHRCIPKNHIFCRIESPEGIYTDKAMENLLQNASADSANSELVRMQREMESGLDIKKFDGYPCSGAYKFCFTCTDLNDLEATKPELEETFNYVVYPIHFRQAHLPFMERLSAGVWIRVRAWRKHTCITV